MKLELCLKQLKLNDFIEKPSLPSQFAGVIKKKYTPN